MKRLIGTSISTVLAIGSLSQIAFAQTNPKDSVVTHQESGYVVVEATANSPKSEFITNSNSSKGTVQPNSITNETQSANTTATYYSSTSSQPSWANGSMTVTSNWIVQDQHSLTSDDYLTAQSGSDFTTGWGGTSPSYDCKEIDVNPGASFETTDTTFSVSVPAGASFSSGTSSGSLSFNPTTNPNTYWTQTNYNYEIGTTGRFLSAQENDSANFVFNNYNDYVTNSTNVSFIY